MSGMDKRIRLIVIRMLIGGLTKLGVTIFYYDDTDMRRETEGLDPDVPLPVNPQ